jgi:hypothetical protein
LRTALNQTYEAQYNDSIGFILEISLDKCRKFDDDTLRAESLVTASIAEVFHEDRYLKCTGPFTAGIRKSGGING